VRGPPGELLSGGFRRQITRRPIGSVGSNVGFAQVTITVFLPRGGRFDLDRLVHTADDRSEQW